MYLIIQYIIFLPLSFESSIICKNAETQFFIDALPDSPSILRLGASSGKSSRISVSTYHGQTTLARMLSALYRSAFNASVQLLTADLEVLYWVIPLYNKKQPSKDQSTLQIS